MLLAMVIIVLLCGTVAYADAPGDKLRERMEARQQIRQMLRDKRLREILAGCRNGDVSDVLCDAQVNAAIADHAARVAPDTIWVELKSVAKQYQAWTPSPEDSQSVVVSRQRLGGNVIVGAVPEGTVRLAFVMPDNTGLYPIAVKTCQRLGATVVVASSVRQMAGPIQQAYEQTGKPVEVMLCSHGNPGYMCLTGTDSQELRQLLCDTRGKIGKIYALGCSTGNGADTRKHHLMRVLAVLGRVPVCGADTTIVADCYNYSASGNLVTVVPSDVHPEIEEFVK